MWRASLTLTFMVLAVGVVSAYYLYYTMPVLVIPSCIMAIIGFISFLILLTLGDRTSLTLSILLFLLNIGVVMGCIWVNHFYYFDAHKLIEPFAGNKILALAIALIAPPIPWVGFVTITAAGAAPIAQFSTLSSEIRQTLPLQEPWMSQIYGIVAVIAYFFRLKLFETQKRLAQIEAKTLLLQEFSHLLLNAQHLANTPLQTIENSVAILRARVPEQEEIIEPLGRAVSKVREVVLLFSYCDSHINWQKINLLPKSTKDFESRLKDMLDKAEASIE